MNLHIKTAMIEAALPDVPFDGWTEAVLERAARAAGYKPEMVRAVFPKGVEDAVSHFAALADAGMMTALAAVDAQGMGVRARIERTAWERFVWLGAHKEAERAAIAFWARPFRKWRGAKIVWRTADEIWRWAGDTATDYNRYTKRMLLMGVLTSTALCFLDDDSERYAQTRAFLNRRLDNALALGRIAGKAKKA